MTSNEPISTYEIVLLQIKALDSILNIALGEPEIDESFRREMEKIKTSLEDFLERYHKAEEQNII